MNDRELLELAAKAAGIEITPHPNARDAKGLMFVSARRNWNPLTDDGDALRLAVKLRLIIQHTYKYVVVLDQARDVAEHQDTRENGGDENAATRRAIVSAAAAIGEKQ